MILEEFRISREMKQEEEEKFSEVVQICACSKNTGRRILEGSMMGVGRQALDDASKFAFALCSSSDKTTQRGRIFNLAPPLSPRKDLE